MPFYPLLFAAYPVLLLYSGNVTEVPVTDLLVVLATVLVGTTIGLVLFSVLFRSVNRAAIVVATIVTGALLFAHLRDAVSPFLPYDTVVWPERPHDRHVWLGLTLVPAWAAMVVIATYLAVRLRARLSRVTETLNVVSVVLTALVFVPILTSTHVTTTEGKLDGRGVVATSAGARAGRDIYHFVFDRYGSGASLEAGYGLDNDAFVAWLEDAGFQVVEDARANYVRTTESLASTFDMALLDELAETMGPSSADPNPLYDRIQQNPAAALLQTLGYRYFHVGSWWAWTAQSSIADHSVQPRFQVSFASTVLDNSILPWLRALATAFGLPGSVQPGNQYAQTTQAQFEAVRAVVDEPGPKLVFAHFMVPHPPYLFLEDGTVAPDVATYETQLAYTNAKIRQLLTPLLAFPIDERPIILLQADEGPRPPRYEADLAAFDWSKATDAERVMKFGVLDAMYLPGPEGEAALPPGLSLVNTYPEILSRYFDIVVPRSPDRSFTSPEGRPYDLSDITDRLDEAEERLKSSPG